MLCGDYRKKVGEYLLDVGGYLNLGDGLDLRLMMRYEGNERVLDQDEVLFDLIGRYSLPAE